MKLGANGAYGATLIFFQNHVMWSVFMIYECIQKILIPRVCVPHFLPWLAISTGKFKVESENFFMVIPVDISLKTFPNFHLWEKKSADFSCLLTFFHYVRFFVIDPRSFLCSTCLFLIFETKKMFATFYLKFRVLWYCVWQNSEHPRAIKSSLTIFSFGIGKTSKFRVIIRWPLLTHLPNLPSQNFDWQ